MDIERYAREMLRARDRQILQVAYKPQCLDGDFLSWMSGMMGKVVTLADMAKTFEDVIWEFNEKNKNNRRIN